MIINSVFICDNCKITLTNDQVRILTNDSRFNKYDIEKILHYCPLCQREADLTEIDHLRSDIEDLENEIEDLKNQIADLTE